MDKEKFKERDGIQKLKRGFILTKTSQDFKPSRSNEKAQLIKIIIEALGYYLLGVEDVKPRISNPRG